MSDDTQPQTQVTDEQVLSEDVTPVPGIAVPVVGPKEYAKVEKWHVDRVFYFLAFTSVICLAFVAIVPTTTMKATAAGIWLGSLGLAKFLLVGAYRNNAGAYRNNEELH